MRQGEQKLKVNRRGIKNNRQQHSGTSLRQSKGPLYGALDLGTNNCRLLIAHPHGNGFRVVSSYSKVVRLGEGLAETGRLSEPAIDRTIEVLKICAETLERFNIKKIRNVSTEACRKASNCREFLARIKSATGLEIEAISVEEEARLALAGCQPLLIRNCAYALVFDIGGGSTEIIWAERLDDGAYQIVDVLSLPIGVVNLAEQYGYDKVTPDCYREMKNFVFAHLPSFCLHNGIGACVNQGKVQMLGTSGTVTTLCAVHLNLPRYSRSRIDGFEINFDALSNATYMLSTLNYADRAALPCIGEERADLVVPGCAILEAICETWPVGRLRIADRGLREGMLLEMMTDDGLSITGNPPASPNYSHDFAKDRR